MLDIVDGLSINLTTIWPHFEWWYFCNKKASLGKSLLCVVFIESGLQDSNLRPSTPKEPSSISFWNWDILIQLNFSPLGVNYFGVASLLLRPFVCNKLVDCFNTFLFLHISYIRAQNNQGHLEYQIQMNSYRRIQ